MQNQLIQEGNALYVLDWECLRQKEMHKRNGQKNRREKYFSSFHPGISSLQNGGAGKTMIVLAYYMYLLQNKK